MDGPDNNLLHDERGFALIMTVFIVSLATILVLDFSSETLAYQRANRAATERVQADYMLKSTINVARLLLELPKLPVVQEDGSIRTPNEDWLGEPWALVASAPVLFGFPGSPRLTIIDEFSKVDINAISTNSPQSPNPAAPNPAVPNPQDPNNNQQAGLTQDLFWMDVLGKLFAQQGFVRERFEPKEKRTLGDAAFEANDQVAVIRDWIDSDSRSHTSAGFPGEGIESSVDATWFYNRPLRSLAELAAVPGMTLERVSRVAPYVRANRQAGGAFSRININTASRAVLLAMGFEETQILELDEQRGRAPLTQADLNALVAGNPFLTRNTTTRSNLFTAYARVEYANVTRWAKALIEVQGSAQRRRALVRSIELH